MIDGGHSDDAGRASLGADLWLFALTWGAGFIFTLVFFS
jgi:hypothetical protein